MRTLVLVIALLAAPVVNAGKWIVTIEPTNDAEEAECMRDQEIDPYIACDIKGTMLFVEHSVDWFCSERKGEGSRTCIKIQIGNGKEVDGGTQFPLNITRTPVRNFE